MGSWHAIWPDINATIRNYPDWCHVLMRHPPYFVERNRPTHVAFYVYIRDMLAKKIPMFYELAMRDPRTLVAQPAWPEYMHEAMGLDDPPTPYEVACYLIRPPPRRLIPAARVDTLSLSLLNYWLAGLPAASLSTLSGLPLSQVEYRLYTIMAYLMTRERFALWALHGDQDAFAGTPRQRELARQVLHGEKYTTDSHQRVADPILESPAIKAQFMAGAPFTPATGRRVIREGMVWPGLPRVGGTDYYGEFLNWHRSTGGWVRTGDRGHNPRHLLKFSLTRAIDGP